jgi:hypothetical protein
LRNFKPVGSVGKKPFSGDIDLAVDVSSFVDREASEESVSLWNVNYKEMLTLAADMKKRARTATDEHIRMKAFLMLLVKQINKDSANLFCDEKKVSNGNVFGLFPQFDEKGNKTDKGVQIDWMIGSMDWLQFSYYSNAYEGNVKGLHRTQLMISMFTNLGLVFNHVNGIKDKDTQEVLARNPREAIRVLNDRYALKGKLTQTILEDYFKLFEFIDKNLDKKDFDSIVDTYLRILDSTRADIPDNLQDEWRKRKSRLGLTGKFLPPESRLRESYSFREFLQVGN